VQRFSLRSRSEEASDPGSERKGFSILLVEDNPADVTLVREALEEHGVEGELMVASDGEQAIAIIQDVDCKAVSCPDLFIVDLNIPRRPGREVIECLRQSVKCNKAQIAILSSSDSMRDKEDATQLGVSWYIRKPSRLNEFLGLGAIFGSLLERSRSSES
jgi:CheY-like chemotaxis protein